MCVFTPVFRLPRELLDMYLTEIPSFSLVLRCFVWFLFPSWLLPSASLTSLLIVFS